MQTIRLVGSHKNVDSALDSTLSPSTPIIEKSSLESTQSPQTSNSHTTHQHTYKPQSNTQLSKLAPQAIYEMKGSKFLGFVVGFDVWEMALWHLREAHPKAVHCVYAYRAYIDGKILERSSDDGEPKGSSGVSVLNVLRGLELVDVAVIVVRYFGGVLLGVGGLVRAYTKATQQALNGAGVEIIPYERLESKHIFISYSALRLAHYHIRKLGIVVCKEEFEAEGVRLHISAKAQALQAFLQEIGKDLVE